MTITAEEHDLAVREEVAELVAAELDAELDEPLGAGYDEGPVLVHEP